MTATPFAWNPTLDDLIAAITPGLSRVEDEDQRPTRYEAVERNEVGAFNTAKNIKAMRAIFADPSYRGGTTFRCERGLEALLLRDALRHYGHPAEQLYDHVFEDAPHMVISGFPFKF